MRWLLLDEIVEIRRGVSAFSKARFPQTEVSPEVLLIEMMAQTGGVLLGAENDYKDDVVFAKISASRFPMSGQPGELLEISAQAQELRPEGGWVQAEVRGRQGILASARIMLANVGKLVPGKDISTTFHQAFMNHFKVREKIK